MDGGGREAGCTRTHTHSTPMCTCPTLTPRIPHTPPPPHTHTRTHMVWDRARKEGLTVNVHLECVISAVTGAVGTEAKALYLPCGSGQREARVRGGSPAPGEGRREQSRGSPSCPFPCLPSHLHPLALVLCLTASFSSFRSQLKCHLH